MDQKRILHSSKTATTDRRSINGTDLVAHFSWSRLLEDSWWHNIYVLPEQVVDRRIEGEPQREGIEKEAPMLESESTSGAGYITRIHDNVRRRIGKPLKEHEKERLRRIIDGRGRMWSLYSLQMLMSVPKEIVIYLSPYLCNKPPSKHFYQMNRQAT